MAKLIVDGETYDIDLSQLGNTEAILLEDSFGWTLPEWMELLERGSAKALTAMLWLIKRRETPGLPFEAVEFNMANLETVADEERPKDDADVKPVEPEETVSSSTSPSGATVHPLTSTG